MKYHDIRKPPRELHDVLATLVLSTPMDSEAMHILNRVFASSSPIVQMRVRWELLERRAAMRGEREAVVA